MTVPVHGVAPAISLAATATLTPLLTDASGSTTSLKPVQATAHGWALPWMLVLVLVVLIAVLVGTYLLPAPQPGAEQGARGRPRTRRR